MKKKLEKIEILLFILLFMQSYLVGALLPDPEINVLTKLWTVSLLVTEFSAVVVYSIHKQHH